MTTRAEKRYLDRVAQLDCVVCGAHGVHIHHAREGQGMARAHEHTHCQNGP